MTVKGFEGLESDRNEIQLAHRRAGITVYPKTVLYHLENLGLSLGSFATTTTNRSRKAAVLRCAIPAAISNK
ncbi:unnamed protein product, partial [Nesidiocoris tenuis]